MNFNKTILLSAATLALLSLSHTAFAAGEVIGINSAVKGDVSVQSGQSAALQAAISDPIRIGDEINSAHLSSLQVLLKDQTVFTVGADCLLTIDKFVYDPATSQNAMTANVAKGMFRFMSGNISKSGGKAVNIDTPVASMGVRGTMVQGLVGQDAVRYAIQQGLIPPNTPVDQNGATLFILLGPGPKKSGKNKKGAIDVTSGGETLSVRRPGSVVFIPNRDGPPIDGGIASEALLDIFSSRLSVKPKGGASVKPFKLDAFMEKEVEDPEIEDVEFFDPAVDLDVPSCQVEMFMETAEIPNDGVSQIRYIGEFEFGEGEFDFHCDEGEFQVQSPLG